MILFSVRMQHRAIEEREKSINDDEAYHHHHRDGAALVVVFALCVVLR